MSKSKFEKNHPRVVGKGQLKTKEGPDPFQPVKYPDGWGVFIPHIGEITRIFRDEAGIWRHQKPQENAEYPKLPGITW